MLDSTKSVTDCTNPLGRFKKIQGPGVAQRVAWSGQPAEGSVLGAEYIKSRHVDFGNDKDALIYHAQNAL